jgi:UDP-2,4-diacetamido-2,4,6-trideoxy-beta-L-altropyranose hydrolase
LDKPRHLLIAADCGTQIGTGHVMRCLAIAQSWKRYGGKATFFLPDGSPGIEERIRTEGLLFQTFPQADFANFVVKGVISIKPDVTVLDGYHFGASEQSSLSSAGLAVMTVDDCGHAAEYPVRWVLNQNVGAQPETYAKRRTDTRLLLGPEYALLRQEFLPWLGWKRQVPEKASKVLVTIGGSDPNNLSLKILESMALLRRPELQVVMVVGGSNPHLQALQSAAERRPVSIRIVQNALDMPALMAWADVAVSAAGGTSYELCYMGLPSLLFVVADNQRGVAEHLSRLSMAVHAGAGHDFAREKFISQLGSLVDSREQRQTISNRGRALVDGVGAERVRAALLDREIKLRRATESDCEQLFSWANDPVVRSASFHSEPVVWENHRRWFSQKLHDSQSLIFLGETHAGEPLGQVRFHINAERATLSIVVAPKFRGAGWGKELIALSVRMLMRTRLIRYVDAFVKLQNQSSIHLFEAAGFRRAGTEQVAGQPALLFSRESGSEPHAN